MNDTRTPDELLRDGLQLLTDSYRSHVRELAADFVKDCRNDDPLMERDTMMERLHELIDSDAWVIYTQRAQAVAMISNNDSAALDNYGADSLLEKGGGIKWSALAYAALEADLLEELSRLDGVDMSADRPLSTPEIPCACCGAVLSALEQDIGHTCREVRQ